MKKLFFGLIATLFFVSCEKETNVETTTHKLQFKFYENPDSSNRNSENEIFIFEGTIIKKGANLSLISDELEMSRTVNQETGLESYIVHRKSTNIENNQQRIVGPRIEFGYFWGGHDCWIAGTWVHGDNGESTFIPGSAATQYLMNICGWSNVC